MMKQTSLIFLVFAPILAGIGICLSLGQPAKSDASAMPANWLDWDVVNARTKKLDADIQNAGRLKDIIDTTVRSLAQKEISYQEACDGVYQNAVEVYPNYCRFLRMGDPRLTLKSMVADRIIFHAANRAERHPGSLAAVELVDNLNKEAATPTFREWCDLPWSQEPH